MASYIGQVKIENTTYPVGSMLYGTSNTAAGTAAKVATLAAFDTLATGVTVHIKFTTANTVTSSATLKVGSTTAKTITNPNGSITWPANSVIAFTYDGTNWVMNSAGGGNVSDSAVSGQYVSAVSQSNGVLSVSRTDFSPSISIGAGTSSAAPTVNVTVNGKSGTAQSITTASTSVYGVTKLSSATNSTSTSLAATASAVKAAYDLADGKQDPITFNTAYNASTNKAATMTDISNAISGLTGAMHFIGSSSTAITDGGTQNPTIDGSTVTTKTAGDVVLYNGAEFVWTGSAWELLGDEGSYALKTSTVSVGSASGWDAGSVPSLSYTAKTVKSVKTNTAGSAASLTTTSYTVPNVTAAGSATTASVASGTLTITVGSAPTIGDSFTIKGVNVFTANTPTSIVTEDISCDDITAWDDGAVPSLTVSATTVVKP